MAPDVCATGLEQRHVYCGYTTAVPVFLLLTDRLDPRRFYLFAAALSSAGALGMGILANGSWSAGAAQLVMGAGQRIGTQACADDRRN